MPPKRGAPAGASDEFDSLTVAQLKEKAKEQGLVTSGTKQDLLARLKACAKKRPAPKAAAESPEPPAKRGKVDSSPKAKAKGRAKPEPEEEEKEEVKPRGKAKAKAKARGKPAEEEEEEEEEKPRAKAKAKAASRPKEEEPKAKAKAKAKAQQAEAVEGPSLEEITPAEGEIFWEDGEFCVELAKSGRATCKKCSEKIMAGVLRIGKIVASDTFDGKITNWFHAACLLSGNLLPRHVGLVAGFSSLRPEEQKAILKFIPKAEDSGGSDSKLATQSKKLHEIQDLLQELPPKDLNEMAVLNEYPTQKLRVNSTLLQLCADGVLFGATAPCEVCKDHGRPGRILLDGEVYKCTGWLTDHLKCSFQTQEPDREVWQLTPAAKQLGNGKLGKMKLKVCKRIFSTKISEDGPSPSQQSTQQAKPPLLNLSVYLAEGFEAKHREELADLVKGHMGTITETITKATCFVVSSRELMEESEELQAAKTEGVPGVDEFFLYKLEAGTVTDMAPNLLWGDARKQFKKIEEVTTQKFVEKEGVNMDSDIGELIERTHVLVDRPKQRVYSEMLSQTDMVSGTNSFYTLCVLESDKDSGGSCYWVWRKWGRIGVSQGGTKLEEFKSSKAAAIAQFSKLYLDKTGNTYGHKPSEFAQKPGKFSRVDIQHKALQRKKAKTEHEEEVDPSQEEAQGGQPLGQLSKAAVEKGNAVLDGIENLLTEIGEGGKPNAMQKAKINAHSAEFYALIPHNFGLQKPPPIDNQDLLGAERALLQFYLRMGFEDIGGEEEEKLTPISGVMELPLPKTLQDGCKSICSKKDVDSCTKKGKLLEAKKAGKPIKVMNQELYGSILLYTSNAIYKQLNQALRDEDREKAEKYYSYLRILFEACARLPTKEVTLWRGVGVDLFDQYKVGSTITWWGVSSCTSDKKVAHNFANGCAGASTVLTVETQTACEISELSFYANESESILLPGTQLKVLSSEKKGKTAHIRLKEVGRQVG